MAYTGKRLDNVAMDSGRSPTKRSRLEIAKLAHERFTKPADRAAVAVWNRGVSPATFYGTAAWQTRFSGVAEAKLKKTALLGR